MWNISAGLQDEFRAIKALHEEGEPQLLRLHVGVLTAWGKTRSWTLSGHFHETWQNDLIHINEALSGWPVKVDYIDFEDIREQELSDYDVIINAGFAGSAWSGGEQWNDSRVLENSEAMQRRADVSWEYASLL